MRKILLLIITSFVFCCTIFIACKTINKDPNEIIYFLKDLKSYTAEVDIEIKNDKQNTSYTGRQFYSNKMGYRLDLAQDRVFVYKDDKIYVNDLINGNKYYTAKDFDGVFRLSFIGEYIKLLYTNEEINITYKEMEGKKYALVELIIPGGNRNTEKAILYIEDSSKLPEKLIIYGINQKPTVVITYKKFVVNGEIDAKLFDVQ